MNRDPRSRLVRARTLWDPRGPGKSTPALASIIYITVLPESVTQIFPTLNGSTIIPKNVISLISGDFHRSRTTITPYFSNRIVII